MGSDVVLLVLVFGLGAGAGYALRSLVSYRRRMAARVSFFQD